MDAYIKYTHTHTHSLDGCAYNLLEPVAAVAGEHAVPRPKLEAEALHTDPAARVRTRTFTRTQTGARTPSEIRTNAHAHARAHRRLNTRARHKTHTQHINTDTNTCIDAS